MSFLSRPLPALRAAVLAFTFLTPPLAAPAVAVAGDAPRDANAVWDLTELYPSVEAWDAARKQALADLPKLEALKGTLGKDAASLRQGLDTISAAKKNGWRIAVYAGLDADADQRVAAAVERRSLSEQLLNDMQKSISWLSNDILAMGAATVEKYIAADKGLSKHAFALRNTLRNAPHTLSEEGEAILAATGDLRGDAENVYQLLVSADIPWPTLKLADGTEAKLNQAGYSRYRQVENRDDRKKVFDTFWGAFESYQDSIGAALYGEVKGNIFNARMRKHPNALAAALFDDNLPESVYRTLVAETNAGLPTLHRYFGLRKKLLKITDDMRYYDIYPPMFSMDKTYTLADSKTITLAGVAPLGPEYLGLLKHGMDSKWTHVYPQEGKRSGAYLNGAAYDVHPYLLLNHNDDYDSLSTFAHEWGHGVHSLLSNKNQPFETADYATFMAEIASILNEFLLNDYMVANAKTKEEKLFFLGESLEGMRGTLFRQVMFAEYELSIHEAVEKGEALTGQKLTEMYCGLLKKYHGDGKGVMKIDELYCNEWAFIPHFYYDFYVFQYATSMAAAAYFADEIKTGGEKVRENYLNILRAGGSDYAYEILKRAGLDMATPAPYRALVARMDRIIGEIETLLAQP